MPEAMPDSNAQRMLRGMPTGCSEQSTQRTQRTNATYVTKTRANHLQFLIALILWISGFPHSTSVQQFIHERALEAS